MSHFIVVDVMDKSFDSCCWSAKLCGPFSIGHFSVDKSDGLHSKSKNLAITSDNNASDVEEMSSVLIQT